MREGESRGKKERRAGRKEGREKRKTNSQDEPVKCGERAPYVSNSSTGETMTK